MSTSAVVPRVVILTSGYPPAILGGGPIRTIEAMIETRISRAPLWIITSAFDLGQSSPLERVTPATWTTSSDGVHVYYADDRSWRGKINMLRELRRLAPEVLYLNSVFSVWFSMVPMLMARLRLMKVGTVVLAPRGQLDPGALHIKRGRKRMLLWIARAAHIYSGVLWHVSSALEADNLQNAAPGSRFVIKEDEVLIQPATDPAKKHARGGTQLLYLGRVSEKKRVHLLINALAGLATTRDDFELHICGGGDSAYIEKCQSAAARLEGKVTFWGSIDRDEVRERFSLADFACFPTAAENFGHVIPEALSQGCPVLVGDVTPWTEVVAAGGGEIVTGPDDETAWQEALGRVLAVSPLERSVRRGKALDAFNHWNEQRSNESFVDLLMDGTLECGS